ncbi:uncharacterized protein FA14DRAFT_31052 [Meira miltonrushii]|uniref:Uncharacterized protein n=1 Tax=Meira miltonrushii TaxID=1280837 RepID=A0A316VE05_9BASI|nr:uncharacterized protein FA14DRAFT_31052 [Meira miltonrushii]PWN34503.1 hypothetical protein FA14DRAFT_31052 [Meira miltonrushii]
MKIRNKQRYRQFVYLICFVHTIIQENVSCIARNQGQRPQIVFQGVYGLPLGSNSDSLTKSYYTPPKSEQQELQKRGGKGMDRHLFASAAAATLAMGTAAMGLSTYSIRLNDWHKYKGAGRDEKKKPGSIDTKAANKDKRNDTKAANKDKRNEKQQSPGSPKYYNSHVIVNNYYGAQKSPPQPAKPAPPPPPKEEAPKKQKRSIEPEEMQLPIRKRAKFKGAGLNKVLSDVSTASSRVGRSTKAAGKSLERMASRTSPVREAAKAHIPASSGSEAIVKAHQRSASKASSPSRRPTQGTLPSHTPQPESKPPAANGKMSRKNVEQVNPVTGKQYAPDTHFLGHDMSKHDKWAKFAGRVEDYGKVSAAAGAFAAGGLALHTTVLQHNHDAKKAHKEEEKKGK